MYEARGIETYDNSSKEPDAKFTDDYGNYVFEELQYFELVEIYNETNRTI